MALIKKSKDKNAKARRTRELAFAGNAESITIRGSNARATDSVDNYNTPASGFRPRNASVPRLYILSILALECPESFIIS